jgi:hypothetical protein
MFIPNKNGTMCEEVLPLPVKCGLEGSGLIVMLEGTLNEKRKNNPTFMRQ